MSRLLTVPYVFPVVLRDISERGRDLEQILSQYITFVKPAFEEFCLPVSKGSDTHRVCQKCLVPCPAPQKGAFSAPELGSACLALFPPCRHWRKWGWQCWPGRVRWGLFI